MTEPKSESQERCWYIQQFEDLKGRVAGIVDDRDKLKAQVEKFAAEVADANRQRKRYEIRCGNFRQELVDIKERILAAEEVVEVARLERNTRWAFHKKFEGDWVVIPREDFVNVREAVAAYDKINAAYDKINEHWHAATGGGKARCVDANCSGERV